MIVVYITLVMIVYRV